jgi:hypothetical protein
MSWVMAGIAGAGLASSIIGGNKAAKSARKAAKTQAEGQNRAMGYMQEREALPMQLREGALGQLGGLYGLPGGTGDQQGFIDAARQDPLYAAMMGNLDEGQNAILRNASALGGLRSGNSRDALARYSTELSNQALLSSYDRRLGGLGGMASLPNNTNAIANMMAGIGQTGAQGQVAGAQAQQAGLGMGLNFGMGVLGPNLGEMFGAGGSAGGSAGGQPQGGMAPGSLVPNSLVSDMWGAPGNFIPASMW